MSSVYIDLIYCQCVYSLYMNLYTLNGLYMFVCVQVVPLSQRSGIVEWCEDTCPLGQYLIGPPKQHQQGAHYRYHPNDWSSLDCRKKLTVSEQF